MTPKMIRLVLGFLAAFVLLSIGPSLPELTSGLSIALAIGLASAASTGPPGDLFLYTAGGLALVGGLVFLLRRWRARPKESSDLGRRIREASRGCAHVPELARRFRLSHDAVRVAIGWEGARPAASRGTSFRSRQPALAAKPKATAVAMKGNHYRALA